MARFNFVIPSLPTKPVGGVKNMFQFANRLCERGHDITFYYAVKRPFKKQRTPVWLRAMIWNIRKRKTNWFKLDTRIQQEIVPEVSDRYIRDADATMCTWWQMAYAVNDLSPQKGLKVNFIQDYELWTGQEDRVHDSYKLPLKHVVIANYLKKIVAQYSGVQPSLVNTPVSDIFKLKVPPAEREPASLMMMYSEEPRKGSKFGLEALEIVKKNIPSLRVTLFSVYPRPDHVPQWMDYHHRPNNLPELYNQHAVFTSPSINEGWGLPAAESMTCGCALAITNVDGHRDFAIDGETALLFEPKDVEGMADKITRLIHDRELRLRLSANGNSLITTQFTWSKAVAELESILLGNSQ